MRMSIFVGRVLLGDVRYDVMVRQRGVSGLVNSFGD